MILCFNNENCPPETVTLHVHCLSTLKTKTMKPLSEFWDFCLERFSHDLSTQQFRTWILPLECEIFENRVMLFAQNHFIHSFIRERYLSSIENYAREFSDVELAISLEIRPKTKKSTPVDKQNDVLNDNGGKEALDASKKSALGKQRIGAGHESTRLDPKYSFETLVTGKGNQLARAAAMQIAENPGDSTYNPFFVYGGVGLGKTHLIQAIGNYIYQTRPQARIRYIHAERYVADIMRAYQNKSFDEFKHYYHSLDLLLIDDIQFFAGKNRTMEEFFYAFNALLDGGRQVIMTCDTIPKHIEGMDERLVSRFSSGLTVEIQPPELEMRVAILEKKAEADHLQLDRATAFFIAERVKSNVRELEGALKRVTAYCRFSNQKVSIESVKEALKDILAAGNRVISIEKVQKTVADYYNIKLSDMHSKKRTRNLVRPRQMAMALAKELTQQSLPTIGMAFGGRDHTTVLHACRMVDKQRNDDSQVGHDFMVLMQMLTN